MDDSTAAIINELRKENQLLHAEIERLNERVELLGKSAYGEPVAGTTAALIYQRGDSEKTILWQANTVPPAESVDPTPGRIHYGGRGSLRKVFMESLP